MFKFLSRKPRNVVGAFLGGLKHFGEFLSSLAEWHAWVIGFGDGVSFQRSNGWEVKEILSEPHYYKAGLALGRLTFFFVVALLVKWVLS